jgi:hypothetical protein
MGNVTVEEALRITFNELRGVSVPAEYSASIGMPIFRALENLNKCINAFAEARKREEEKQAEGDKHEDGREDDAE